MARGRAEWDDSTTKIFLDLCISEKEKHNFHKKGLTKQGWQNIYCNFRQQTGKAYDNKTFGLWRKLKNKSGPGWDQATGTITETPQWWADQITENDAYEQFRNRGIAHEDELITLFGSEDSEDGQMLCIGGLEDRTTSGGSDANIVGLPEDNLGWSEDNVGRSSVGRVAQRPGKEQVVDSPPSKKCKSMEYCVECISESMIQRCKNETAAMTREREEMTELLQLVQEDCVALDSELYFIATELLRTTTRHIAFRSFATAEQRIAWLRWTWENVENK
ncbi:hypothetical protein BS78_08G173900 [Paspalum vaginatum]|nr:hypothetical protein BS78_08G173900 [Paspalum vaginatum]